MEWEYVGDKKEDTPNAQLIDHSNMSAILPTSFSYLFESHNIYIYI